MIFYMPKELLKVGRFLNKETLRLFFGDRIHEVKYSRPAILLVLNILCLILLSSCQPVHSMTKSTAATMKMIKVNRAKLYCEIAGAGLPVVFIHGFSLDTRMWDGQFTTFAKDHQVIRYDLRGFGRSDLPVEGDLYNHHVDLAALLDSLGIEKAVLVGLSLGGRVATSFTLFYPERVLGLVLVDSVLEGYVMKDYEMEHVYEAARNRSISSALELWYEHPTFETTRRQRKTAVPLKRIIMDYSGWHFTHKNPWLPSKPPAIERLNEIQAPTFVIVGEDDRSDFQETSSILHRNIPHSKFLSIPDAGHMSNMDQPAVFNEALHAFLKESLNQ